MAVLGQVLDQTWSRIVVFLQGETSLQPRIFAVIVFLILGLIGGRMVSELVRTFLKMTSIDELAVKSDAQSFLRQLGYRGSLSDLIADLVKWAIYLIAVISVLYMFGFRFVTDYWGVTLDWSTKLLLATAVFLLGAMIADRLEQLTIRLFRVSRITGLVDDSGAEIPVYVIAGRAVKYVGLLVALLVALGVAGVDLQILNVLLALMGLGIIAALVLGTRDLARNISVSIYFQLSRVFHSDDVIRVGEYRGRIAGVRPLYTKLDSGGKTFYVPNWKMVTEVIEREEG